MPKHIAKTTEQYRIRLVTDAVAGITAAEARAELEAEDWDVADAVFNLRAMLKEKAKAFRADPANHGGLAIFQSPEFLRCAGYI